MEKTIPTKKTKEERYFEGLGRRKTATARVRIWPNAAGKASLTVNGEKHSEYFKTGRLEASAFLPLKVLNLDIAAEAKTYGGGITGQAEAVALGISRAVIKWSPNFKPLLSASGLLTRDSRAVERKKPGKRKARRAHQWKKR